MNPVIEGIITPTMYFIIGIMSIVAGILLAKLCYVMKDFYEIERHKKTKWSEDNERSYW